MKTFGTTALTRAPKSFPLDSQDLTTPLGEGVPAQRSQDRIDIVKAIANFQEVIRERPDAGLAPILPLIFRLKGKPFDIIDGHFLFEHEFVLHDMPRRQIDKAGRQLGKSQSKAAGGVIRAAAHNYYNLLTVTPLFEQIRKFSNNYVKPLLRESAVRSYLLAKGSDQQVLQRTLSNGSTLFYNYASNSADRIRGTAADEMSCLRRGTPVRRADGTRCAVERLRPGDVLLSLDAGGVSTDTVLDIVYQNRRPLWRVTFTDGTALEVTDNEMLATDSGWCFLADLFTDSAHSGDPPRGRTSPRTWNQAPSLLHDPRGPAEGVSAAQGGSLGAADPNAAKTASDQRFRISELAGQHPDHRAPYPVLGAVLSRGQEDDNTGLVGARRASGAGVLVHGRRIPEQRLHRKVSHPGVWPGRDRSAGELVDQAGVRRFRVIRQGEILACRAACRRRETVADRDKTVHAPLPALQDRNQTGLTNDQLRLLWQELPSQGEAVQDPTSGLRLPRLLALATADVGARVHDPGTPGTQGGSGAGTLPPGHRGHPCEVSTAERGVAADAQRSRALRPVEIASIEYVGEDDVYDVVLAKHHVFFAGDGDVLVHNCDEIQDFDLDVLPVIQSCLDASPFKIERYAGTPKTFDNPLQVYWSFSSQGIWHIPCQEMGCRHENRCTVADDGDLLKLIGDGQRRKDGRLNTLICAKCHEPLNSRLGYFIHGYPNRRKTFAGFHKPQVVFPLHYESALAWDKILDTARNKPKYLFYNECLGESIDTGQKLITIKDLKDAGIGKYQAPSAFDRTKYLMTCVGSDWGGKGKEKTTDTEEFISNTCFALGGIRGDGVVEITWGYQTPYSADHFQEAGMCREAAAVAGADFIAHDYGGAGDVRESILVRSGWPLQRILPFTYVAMGLNKNIVTFAPGPQDARQSYSLDKARSILLLCELIKAKKVIFPAYEGRMAVLMNDFLALYSEKRDNPRGGSSILINRIHKQHDDFVHAVNFVCMGLFHRTGKWPNLGSVWDDIMKLKLVGSDGTEESLKPGLWLPADVL